MASTILRQNGSDPWTTNQQSARSRRPAYSKNVFKPRSQVSGIKVIQLGYNTWPQAKPRTRFNHADLYPKVPSTELGSLFGRSPGFLPAKLEVPFRLVNLESHLRTAHDVQPTVVHKTATALIAPIEKSGVFARQLPTHHPVQSVDLEDDVKYTPNQPRYIHNLPVRSRIAKAASCTDVSTASQQPSTLEICAEQTGTKSRSFSPGSIVRPKIQVLADHQTSNYCGQGQGWFTDSQGQSLDQNGNSFASGDGGGSEPGNDDGPDRGEGESDDGDQEDGGAEQGGPEQPQGGIFPCWHYARDPVAHRDCASNRFRSYSTVRNHAIKHHPPYKAIAAQCYRCKRLFSDKDECKQHKQVNTCPEAEGLIWRGASHVQKWELTFEFLFPRVEVPMPRIWGHVLRLKRAEPQRLAGTSEQEYSKLREENEELKERIASLEAQATATKIGAEAMRPAFSTPNTEAYGVLLAREAMGAGTNHDVREYVASLLKASPSPQKPLLDYIIELAVAGWQERKAIVDGTWPTPNLAGPLHNSQTPAIFVGTGARFDNDPTLFGGAPHDQFDEPSDISLDRPSASPRYPNHTPVDPLLLGSHVGTLNYTSNSSYGGPSGHMAHSVHSFHSGSNGDQRSNNHSSAASSSSAFPSLQSFAGPVSTHNTEYFTGSRTTEDPAARDESFDFAQPGSTGHVNQLGQGAGYRMPWGNESE